MSTGDVGEMAEGGERDTAWKKAVDMDDMIDEILAKKGPQKYQDGLSEDNWEEEMEKIPLFMTKPPVSIDPEKDTALSALQQLKYETSTPEGRALAHKEEGNNHFKKKKYKLAVEEYSAGIKEKCSDTTLNAVLYSNRAAAQYHLGNYRSAITDATNAKKLKPDHLKALLRGALACQKLQVYEELIQWCDEGLKIDAENATLIEMRAKAIKEKKKRDRDRRKTKAADKAKFSEQQKILDAIESRGIQMGIDEIFENEDIPFPALEVVHPSGAKVHFDEHGDLVWPVVFYYPEYSESDFIANFHEKDRFLDHMAEMFCDNPPSWDKQKAYKLSTMEIYYESCITQELCRVPIHWTLSRVLTSPGFEVHHSTPSFIVIAANTAYYKHYMTANKSSPRK